MLYFFRAFIVVIFYFFFQINAKFFYFFIEKNEIRNGMTANVGFNLLDLC